MTLMPGVFEAPRAGKCGRCSTPFPKGTHVKRFGGGLRPTACGCHPVDQRSQTAPAQPADVEHVTCICVGVAGQRVPEPMCPEHGRDDIAALVEAHRAVESERDQLLTRLGELHEAGEAAVAERDAARRAHAEASRLHLEAEQELQLTRGERDQARAAADDDITAEQLDSLQAERNELDRAVAHQHDLRMAERASLWRSLHPDQPVPDDLVYDPMLVAVQDLTGFLHSEREARELLQRENASLVAQLDTMRQHREWAAAAQSNADRELNNRRVMLARVLDVPIEGDQAEQYPRLLGFVQQLVARARLSAEQATAAAVELLDDYEHDSQRANTEEEGRQPTAPTPPPAPAPAPPRRTEIPVRDLRTQPPRSLDDVHGYGTPKSFVCGEAGCGHRLKQHDEDGCGVRSCSCAKFREES